MALSGDELYTVVTSKEAKGRKGCLVVVIIGTDSDTVIPEFVFFINASTHDVNALDSISFDASIYYIIDRGYADCERLYKIQRACAFLVAHIEENMDYRLVYSHKR